MTYVEIFASYLITECDQRAFVLRAVGIEHLVTQLENRFALLVPEEFAQRALDQLQSYDEESRPRPPPPALRLHPRAWIGSVVFAVLLLGIAYFAGENTGGYDWYGAGALQANAIKGGEIWRWVTALTLHADVAHILGNLLFGVPYGFFASQLLGGARAWLTILLASVFGNMLDSALMHSYQSSIGASTGVFAMLGIVAAFAWRRGEGRFKSWAHRAAPLIAAIALLGMTGVGDEKTDIVAHLAGFACGVIAGVAQGHFGRGKPYSRLTSIALGVTTCVTVAGAWMWGLSSAG